MTGWPATRRAFDGRPYRLKDDAGRVDVAWVYRTARPSTTDREDHMPIRRAAIALLATTATLLAPSAAAASNSAVVLHACAVGKVRLHLSISHADKVPVVTSITGTAPAIVDSELAEVRTAANGICPGSARATVRAQAGHLLSQYRQGPRSHARSTLRRLLATIRVNARKASSVPPAHAADGGCTFDGSVHIRPLDAAGVADDLAAAQAAQQGGDQAGAEEAMHDAQHAYEEWVGAGAGGAQTAGDWIAVAAAAQTLGLEKVADNAIAHAQGVGREALDQCEKIDPCSITKESARSVVRALAFAMLLGIDQQSDSQAIAQLLEAAQEALNGKTPNGCEQWSLSAQLIAADGWSFNWGPGSFRVNRKIGVIQDAPGVAAGWPGNVGAFSGPCTENGVVVGTGSVPASPFHFNISGSVTGTGLFLELTASDAHVAISVVGPPACQFLGTIGQQFVDAFLAAPFPIELSLSPGQTSTTVQVPLEGGATMTVTADRTS